VQHLDKVNVDGLTAIATNADEGETGPVIVQGDHSYVEIRKFTVTPLVRQQYCRRQVNLSPLRLVQRLHG
jgi:hypothetical protein